MKKFRFSFVCLILFWSCVLLPILLNSGAGASYAQSTAPAQVVYLDFVSQNISDPSRIYPGYAFLAAERSAILQNVQKDYQNFNFTFTLTPPTTGPYATLRFNADISGGAAVGGIDVRNQDPNGLALINNRPRMGGINQPPLTSDNMVRMSSKTAAHELGHLVGLWHEDSYGPIGGGMSKVPGAKGLNPIYPGPVAANETIHHIMGSPLAVGQTYSQMASEDMFFSERSAIKLAFNEAGTVVAEQAAPHSSIATAQPVNLEFLPVPNLLSFGKNASKQFFVYASTVTGDISQPGQADVYSFYGYAGEVFNIEVFSRIARFANSIDAMVRVFDATGAPVPYYTSTAYNNNRYLGGYESPTHQDPMIVDLILPKDGVYFIRVNAASSSDTGNYELFFHTFQALYDYETSSLIPALVTGAALWVTLRLMRKRGIFVA